MPKITEMFTIYKNTLDTYQHEYIRGCEILGELVSARVSERICYTGIVNTDQVCHQEINRWNTLTILSSERECVVNHN